MNGFYNTSDVLSHDCSADTGTLTTTLDSVEMAIAEMRSGSALAVPDLFVCNPLDWSAMRRLKTSYGEFLLAPDPSGSETNSLWGVEVIVTVQNPAGRALLIDTQKMGRVAIRSPLGMRIGFANDDFTRNLVRYVGEERCVLTVERPAAVMVLKNLPTPTTTATAAAKK